MSVFVIIRLVGRHARPLDHYDVLRDTTLCMFEDNLNVVFIIGCQQTPAPYTRILMSLRMRVFVFIFRHGCCRR